MERKANCHNCKKFVNISKFFRHGSHSLCSHPTSSTSTQSNVHVNDHSKNEDLNCLFCDLQLSNSKLLEIHMKSCQYKYTTNANIPQICKLCRSPIQLRNRDQQCCANCSIAKDGSQENNSRSVVPERSIKNGDFATVNCTDTRSHLLSSRKMAPTSDSRKQREVKLKGKDPKHQIMQKKTRFNNLKTANSEGSIKKQIRVDVKQARELHHPPDKLCKSSGKNTVQQKKDFKTVNAEVKFNKLKNNNSQKHNSKNSKRIDKRMQQASKKNDYLPGKSNPTHNVVKLQLLHDSITEKDCGMLLQSSLANKIDHFYKCCRCGKTFGNIKSGSEHNASCKSTKFLSNVVDVSDIRWVCTICHSFFLDPQKLLNHLKGHNILTRTYETDCEKRCEKCHFRCISKLSFANHDCAKELESMKTCTVKLNPVKIYPIMRECEFCGEIFDEQLTEQHFRSHHPGQSSSGNFKQYYVNTNLGPSRDTVVIKTEPVSPVHEFVGNTSYGFEETEHYSHVNSRPPDPVLDNISMPPPPINLPVLKSSVSLSREPSSSHRSFSENARVINQKICKCVDRNVRDDVKPCLECLSKLDITKFTKNLKVIPYKLAKIKKEASEEAATQADGIAAASSTQRGNDMDITEPQFSFVYDFPTLTPPSSHHGISPPPTPTTLAQSLVPAETFSASDISMGSLNDDISIVNDISESRCADELVHYIIDDDQELFIPIEYPKMMHFWDLDDLDIVDAWAVVPSEGNETIEKYICSGCISFSCPDQSSIIRHLCEDHEKKHQFLAMYIVKADDVSQ